ncbi:MAG: RNA polymerase sigma factor [Pirellulales bacterium]|nr:RNA polymerase sigma factor [Pirellulales bacterium]
MSLAAADFQRLVDEHGAVLYRLAYRLIGDSGEAEDVVQETFRSVWKSRRRFDPARGERAWLTAILRRRAADRWRRQPPCHVHVDDSLLEVGFELPDPAESGYSDEMQWALDQLAPELRETLLLVVVGELTHQEAGRVLQVPLGTVLSRVARARARLRQLLSVQARCQERRDTQRMQP